MISLSVQKIDDWELVANTIALRLTPGMILAIQGPLGAGKTTLIQYLAKILGTDKQPKSPTFSLLKTYALSHATLTRLVHVDAYRIEREEDLLPLDLDEELLIPGTVLAIEWPEHIQQWLQERGSVLRVDIVPKNQDDRLVLIHD